ncbi:MAG: NAD(P)-binding protein [Bacillota bacterium]|jgi:heterodisulfide reductase subunit A-like polyferredoxin
MSETTTGNVKGSVLVVGGGISGMQSALDLAEAGLKVYLAEEKTAIGGTMSRLDKTFPTNDCAMCIVSPKLVDVGKHLNIEILTGAKLQGVEGEQGNFKVKLRKKARYVDMAKCTGCGECATACPVELPSEFDGGLGQRKAAYKLYAQAMPSAYAIEKNDLPPCRAACPAGINVQGYVQLVKQGKMVDSWRIIYNDNPLPGVCGRVCTHPCETNCHRGEVDSPVSIRELKRLAADAAYNNIEELPLPEIPEPLGKRVAVIGAGPAGLSAAYQLAKKGYGVTIFEALPVAGGMLSVGIPAYRLPKELVELEIGLLQKMGIEIKTGARLGRDFTIDDLPKQGYVAILLAIGAHKGIFLHLPGEDLDGVMPGVDFLRKVNLGEEVKVGRRVAVIGGGNTAMDAARTALRLGAAEVTIVYRRSESEITAAKDEIHEALEEGVKFQMLTGPKAILGEGGRVTGLECLLNELGEPDAGGRRRPVPIAGSEFVIDVDTVITAVGQSPDPAGLDGSGLELGRGNTVKADPASLVTGRPGVFAAGDVVTGPATVIDAIGAGKKAAANIHLFLQGEELTSADSGREQKVAPFPPHVAGNLAAARARPVYADPAVRVTNFAESALGLSGADGLKEAGRCLNCSVCSECRECVKVCLPQAIDHDMRDEDLELEVGAVLLSPGADIYNPAELDYLGYKKYPNVVTSIEFERILSASGPFQGHLIRPSDGREPGKIAWIQCVGSRNLKLNHDYCSSVCCMYAIKEAVIAKEHSHEPLDTTIFLMDMRSYGKDFEKYYNRARDEHGVRFIKSRIFEVQEAPDQGGSLTIRYALDDGTICQEEFDLVVLSVGFKPSCGSRELAAVTGIELDEFGFCKSGEFSRGVTSRPGIYASGVFAAPKDIPETVVEASAVAGYASRLLSGARGALTRVKHYPPEKPVTKAAPRIGAFICNCGINIGSVIDVPDVVNYTKTLKNVVYAREFLFSCSQDSIDHIKQAIEENNLNRVVVASCTPRTHAQLFQSALREAGLNPYLYEHVNIREHSSWVHRDTPKEATEKAKDLVRMAVAKAMLLKPVTPTHTDVNHASLVVGGGAAGMSAALSLAEQGFDVYLVEKSPELGGRLRQIHFSLEGADPQQELRQLIDRVSNNSKITVITGAGIESFAGYPGNYRTKIKLGDKTRELEHGATILATGAQEAGTGEYLYGQHPRVVTQTELEEKLATGGAGDVQTLVMIQCVGSRDAGRPYCSRVCCSQALKNALKFKELNPDAGVFILYRDIRSYGLKEKYYTRARRKGIVFIRYSEAAKPLVTTEGDALRVVVKDHILGENIALRPDLLALSTGVVPNLENTRLSQIFKVPLDADGFLLEAHMKLRPVDFAADGLYMCGLAHAPKLAGESMQQANAAAMRAATLLAKDKLENVPITATVNKKRCVGCMLCKAACSYQAREFDPVSRTAIVREALCRGCGACVVACPNGATQQKGYEKSQMMAALKAALK